MLELVPGKAGRKRRPARGCCPIHRGVEIEMRLLLFVIGLLAAFATSAQERGVTPESPFPQRLTAKDLLFACASSSLSNLGRERQRYCSGFVSGVEEAVRLHRAQGLTYQERGFCVKEKTTSRELARAYTQYASRDSTDLDKPAALVVIEALEDVFPCTR